MNVVRSQYFMNAPKPTMNTNQILIPQNLQQHPPTQFKRISSAPSSPMHTKFISNNDLSQKTNETQRTILDTSKLQNREEKKVHIEEIRPTKPLFPQTTNPKPAPQQSSHPTTKNEAEEYYNEYYEFTRPKKTKKESDTGNNSGVSSKGKKTKKISIVSSTSNIKK